MSIRDHLVTFSLQLDIYIYTLGNFFFIYLPSARMQDHQRCVVAARFGCVVVCIVLSIGLLMFIVSQTAS